MMVEFLHFTWNSTNLHYWADRIIQWLLFVVVAAWHFLVGTSFCSCVLVT